LAALVSGVVIAQPMGSGQEMGPGMMGPGGSQMPMGRGMQGGKMPMQPQAQKDGEPTGPEMQGRGMPMSPGMMGPGMMGMMGRGMMGPGMMGMMGHRGQMRDRNLSADEVKRVLDGRLAWQGLKRLKVGKTKVVDDDTVAAEIVTKEDSLVVRLNVDRHTGHTVIAD
jgi:hypothetical protein